MKTSPTAMPPDFRPLSPSDYDFLEERIFKQNRTYLFLIKVWDFQMTVTMFFFNGEFLHDEARWTRKEVYDTFSHFQELC